MRKKLSSGEHAGCVEFSLLLRYHKRLVKGERCGVAAPRINAPHYSTNTRIILHGTHSHACIILNYENRIILDRDYGNKTIRKLRRSSLLTPPVRRLGKL